MGALLEIENLRTQFFTSAGTVQAVDGISYTVEEGETVAIVGESGCGKSVSALSVLRLIPDPPGRIVGGNINFAGKNLLELSDSEIRNVRGRDITMIFQEPMSSLNPLLTIERQLTETIMHHLSASLETARARAIELLELVGISDAERRLKQYPHHFSGGMRQRVVIALALCAEPRLIIADEPTTALDVSIQAQIITLLKRLCHEHGTAVMLVTHDMGVIAEAADRVAVMYSGRIAEIGLVQEVVQAAKHPYTHGLMGSIPHIGHHVDQLTQIKGSMPRLQEIPAGCPFNPRCAQAMDRCRSVRPDLQPADKSRVACHLFDLEYAEAGDGD